VRGDPTDAAFLAAEAKTASMSLVRRSRFRRVAEVPFTAERRLTSSIEADTDRQGRLTVVTKGAPDALLPRCTQERVGSDARPLTDERRREILAAVEGLADQALRTLAVAYRSLDTDELPADKEGLERGLVYVGTVGIVDPPRPEAETAVAEAIGPGYASS
jgi:magnesium-transporting ATPase (P-type)